MKKKPQCPKCRSPKIRKITGAAVGNPLKSRFFEAVLAQCAACGNYFVLETETARGRKRVTVKQVMPWDDGGEGNNNPQK